jgi:hypothetical protein
MHSSHRTNNTEDNRERPTIEGQTVFKGDFNEEATKHDG